MAKGYYQFYLKPLIEHRLTEAEQAILKQFKLEVRTS